MPGVLSESFQLRVLCNTDEEVIAAEALYPKYSRKYAGHCRTAARSPLYLLSSYCSADRWLVVVNLGMITNILAVK